MLSKESIEEFRQLYEKRFRKNLSDGEAQQLATNLLTLYKIIYKKTFDKMKIVCYNNNGDKKNESRSVFDFRKSSKI